MSLIIFTLLHLLTVWFSLEFAQIQLWLKRNNLRYQNSPILNSHNDKGKRGWEKKWGQKFSCIQYFSNDWLEDTHQELEWMVQQILQSHSRSPETISRTTLPHTEWWWTPSLDECPGAPMSYIRTVPAVPDKSPGWVLHCILRHRAGSSQGKTSGTVKKSEKTRN